MKHKAVLCPKYNASLTVAVELAEATCFYNGTAHPVTARGVTVLESASPASASETQQFRVDYVLLGLHENVPFKNGNHDKTEEHLSMHAKLFHMLPNSRSWEDSEKMHREKGGPGCNLPLAKFTNMQTINRWSSMPALH